MDESIVNIPRTPQVTEKAEDEGGKGAQSMSSSNRQTQGTEKTENEGGKNIYSSILKGGKDISSFMLKGVKGFFFMQKPPDKANDQVGIPPQSNNVPHMFPPGLSHLLPDGSENIESELLPLDRQPNFEELVKNMIGDTPKIREWYERGLSKSNKDRGRMMARYTDKELGRMMARSGLLLLEFLRSLANLPRSNEFFRPRDRQLSVQEAVIKIDNRIPIFVLKKILEWERDADTDLHSILKHASLKLSPIRYDVSHVIAEVQLKDDSHLLAFLYETIIGSSDRFIQGRQGRRNKGRVRDRYISLPLAVKLKGKGVDFARNEGLLNKIRFENLTLYLPAIEMDSGTDAVLRNLVLFEASKQVKESQPLMSYVQLMDHLIDTAEDVQALVEGGIIHPNLGSNIEVAKVWNGMCKLIDKKIKYEPIDKAIYDVKNFYTNKYKTMCTEFYRTHFLKPWSAISFFAACILFALAGFQTYLAWEQVRLQRESMPKT